MGERYPSGMKFPLCGLGIVAQFWRTNNLCKSSLGVICNMWLNSAVELIFQFVLGHFFPFLNYLYPTSAHRWPSACFSSLASRCSRQRVGGSPAASLPRRGSARLVPVSSRNKMDQQQRFLSPWFCRSCVIPPAAC